MKVHADSTVFLFHQPACGEVKRSMELNENSSLMVGGTGGGTAIRTIRLCLPTFDFLDGAKMSQAKIRWDWREKDGRALLGRLWDPRLRADTDERAMAAVQEALDAVEGVCGPNINKTGPKGDGWYYSIFREDARRVPYGLHPEGGLRAGDAHEHVQYSFHLWLVFPTETEMLAVRSALPIETRV